MSDPIAAAIADHEARLHGIVPPPDPEPGTGPSGILIPGVKTGWQRAGVTDFGKTIASGWTGDEDGVLMGRASGDDTSKRGTYTLAGLTQHDNLLDIRAWQDAAGRHMGCPLNKVAGGVVPEGQPKGALNLRVEFALKVDRPEAGWKIAFMVAKYGAVRAQEFDYPEAAFDADGNASAFSHASGTDKRFALPDGTLYGWHRYSIERRAGQYVAFGFDGREIGRVTSGITQDRVHFIGQVETQIGGTLPANMGEAHVLLDWITVDVAA